MEKKIKENMIKEKRKKRIGVRKMRLRKNEMKEKRKKEVEGKD